MIISFTSTSVRGDDFWYFYHKFQIWGYVECKVTTLLTYSTNLAHFSESFLGQRFMLTVLQTRYLHSFMIYFNWAAAKQGMKKSGRYSLVSCSSFILGQTLVFFQPLWFPRLKLCLTSKPQFAYNDTLFLDLSI